MKNKMYPYTLSGNKSVQVESELKEFISILKQHNVQSYLEIGAGRGDTFYEVVTQVLSPLPAINKAVAIDYPEQDWGLSSSEKDIINAIFKLVQLGYNSSVEFGDSGNPEMVERISRYGQFDAIFIDGAHDFISVGLDWSNYSALANKIVAFHDIADPMKPNKKGEVIEVPRLWKEIKNNITLPYKYTEIIEEGSTMGIGVLFL